MHCHAARRDVFLGTLQHPSFSHLRRMPPDWSASLDQDGCLHMSSGHIFELAAIVHGYSLDSVLITDSISQPAEAGSHRRVPHRFRSHLSFLTLFEVLKAQPTQNMITKGKNAASCTSWCVSALFSATLIALISYADLCGASAA